jgi:hypothetical protein
MEIGVQAAVHRHHGRNGDALVVPSKLAAPRPPRLDAHVGVIARDHYSVCLTARVFAARAAR